MQPVEQKQNLQNLELKAYNAQTKADKIAISMKQYFSDTLSQTDAYYKTRTGQRLKIRSENNSKGDRTYAILYDRPDTESAKLSTYTFYEIQNPDIFEKVFGVALEKEIEVVKIRQLYLYKNARIHVDNVLNLGTFIEIEVVIRNPESEPDPSELMNELIGLLDIGDETRISVGYREMLIGKMTKEIFDGKINKDIERMYGIGTASQAMTIISGDRRDMFLSLELSQNTTERDEVSKK